MDDWADHLAGARMRVDQQFEQRVVDSQFTSQEWGLIMTAVEFDIRQPGDPERAHMIAVTEDLEAVIPALEDIQQEMGANMGPRGDTDGGGILGRLRSYVGSLTDSGSGMDEEQLDAARVLIDDYADQLQAHLEEQSRWAEVCAMADEAKLGAGD